MTRTQLLALCRSQPPIPMEDMADRLVVLEEWARPTWWSRLCARVRARFS